MNIKSLSLWTLYSIVIIGISTYLYNKYGDEVYKSIIDTIEKYKGGKDHG